MWPSSSITKPEPVAVPPRFGFGFAEGAKGAVRFGCEVDCGFDEGDAVAVALVDLVDDVALRPSPPLVARPAPSAARRRSSSSRRSDSIQPAAIAIQPKAATTSAAKQRGAEGGAEESSWLAHRQDMMRRRAEASLNALERFSKQR